MPAQMTLKMILLQAMNVIKLSKYITTYLSIILIYSTSVFAQSYPDFTEIVEQNMPAVVIVNATRYQ